MGELRGHFRPEFLNRVDDMVIFHPLGLPEIERIVDLLFTELRRRLAEQRITSLTEPGRRLIASRATTGLRRPAATPLHLARGGDQDRPRVARGEARDGVTILVDARARN